MDKPGACILTSDVGSILREQIASLHPASVTVLTDEHTRTHCYPKIQPTLPEHHLITVPAGEENKTIDGAARIWQEMTDLRLDRKSLFVVLGGGVLGDMGGFCAATYKRGIPFILIPTTLLAQVDASVGGKLGIDFRNFKNHIGVFQHPHATIIDTLFLRTLPAAERRSGFAEIIKHCFLSDSDMWNTIRMKNPEEQDWHTLVAHSVAFKQSVVDADPTEKGLRKILNFGHTIGHAVESASLSGKERLLHGDAIAVGMVAESYVARRKEILGQEPLDQLTAYLIKIFGHREIETDDETLIGLMLQDKKTSQGKILLALADGKGGHRYDIQATPEDIREGLSYYRSIHQR